MRIGHGYDVHKLVENRDLILGGVKIPYERDFWAILMRMSCSMRFLTAFWALLPLGISVSIFPILILPIKVQILWNYYESWDKRWRKQVIKFPI